MYEKEGISTKEAENKWKRRVVEEEVLRRIKEIEKRERDNKINKSRYVKYEKIRTAGRSEYLRDWKGMKYKLLQNLENES